MLRFALVAVLVACSSQDAALHDACTAGAACTCTDGNAGTTRCAADGTLAACACTTLPPCLETRAVEYCDGRDNDCNGVVDDGEVCPDATVAGAVPSTGGVYFEGTTFESQCSAIVLQRFWPTQATSYIPTAECSEDYAFRRDNGALFARFITGRLREVAGGDVATPPCTNGITSFDFDGAGQLHYQCDGALYRAGVLVAQDVSELVGVFDDGRMIVIRTGAAGREYALLDAAGRELSRPLPSGLVGTMSPIRRGGVVAGNRGYVAYLRDMAFGKQELVVFVVDEHAAWQRVRRLELPQNWFAAQVISDGTVFIRGPDLDDPKFLNELIVAYLPDGTTRIAWRERDSVVKAHGGHQILVGPP